MAIFDKNGGCVAIDHLREARSPLLELALSRKGVQQG
jgi:hypothetical protein